MKSAAKEAYDKRKKELRNTFDLVNDVVQYALSACIPDPSWSNVGDLTHLHDQLQRALER